jgi:hypothetical protein
MASFELNRIATIKHASLGRSEAGRVLSSRGIEITIVDPPRLQSRFHQHFGFGKSSDVLKVVLDCACGNHAIKCGIYVAATQNGNLSVVQSGCS